MSVTATTSVSDFMTSFVESQGRTSPDFSTLEEAAIDTALAQFSLTASQLDQVDKLLEALEVMRGMVAAGSLSPTSLDAIELSIQTLLQGATVTPVGAPPPAPAQPLPPAVQAFSDEYLTSTYLQDATVWPGADARLQADLATFDLAPREVSVASQYMYSIADQRRYLAAIDAALQAPDGFLYATPTEPDYQAYLNYVQARAATAAEINGYVAAVQGILAGTVNVWDVAFDPIPWSVQLTDPQTAVPPSTPTNQTSFEISEDKYLLTQLGSQARMMEGQISQLAALLSPRAQPPLVGEQIVLYSTQLSDLKRQLRLINAETAALRARLAYNTAIAAGHAMAADGLLQMDLDVDVAQANLVAFMPTPINTGPSDPVPTSTLQTQLSQDKAAYHALVVSPPPPPADPDNPDAPLPPPPPTQQLLQSYISQLDYLMVVPTGMVLTSEQVDELGVLWAHRAALKTQYQRITTEMAALQARIDYAEAVLGGWKPYQTSVWNQLSVNVATATAARELGETVQPTAGAVTTPPPDTMAWKRSGADAAHIAMTRIENFLLTAEPDDWIYGGMSLNDWVYAQLDFFAASDAMASSDVREAPLAKAAVVADISTLPTGTNKTDAQRQLDAINALIALYPAYAADADEGYANAESARTVTDYTQVTAQVNSVIVSLQAVQHDDYLVAEQKMLLADANYDRLYPSGGSDPRALYLQAVSVLSVNAYNQAKYTYLASVEGDEEARDDYLEELAGYEAAYAALLTDTLARFYDAAYTSAGPDEWPRTVSGTLTTQEKAVEVTDHYNGNVYPVIDPLQTTILPSELT